jgi:hypothetical protein
MEKTTLGMAMIAEANATSSRSANFPVRFRETVTSGYQRVEREWEAGSVGEVLWLYRQTSGEAA